MNEQEAVPHFVDALLNEKTAELRAAFDRQSERVAALSASERILAKERNDYKERAERAEAGWQEAEREVGELRAHLADAIRRLKTSEARAKELEHLLHANEQAFDEDTNAAVDELDMFKSLVVWAETILSVSPGVLAHSWCVAARLALLGPED